MKAGLVTCDFLQTFTSRPYIHPQPPTAQRHSRWKPKTHRASIHPIYIPPRADSLLSKSFVSQQSTSPLLRLPAELRNKIYAYVFSGYRISVIFFPGGGSFCYATLSGTELRFHSSGRKAFKTIIAFSRTCRLLYAESRVLPYKYSTYRISLVLNFTFWLLRLDEELQDAVWGALNESQRLYIKEVRDERGW